MATMKAVGIKKPGAASELQDVAIDIPGAPTGFDVKIKVNAVALNPVDFKVRLGMLGGPTEFNPPRVLGWDGSGVIEAVGDKVTLFKKGDEVYWAGDVTRPGSNAEYCVVDSRIVGFKPKSLNWAAAAAFPLVTLTAWESLFDRLRIARDGSAAGKSLLVVNASGGVGSLAIQLAKLLVPGLKVIGTAGKAESFDWVKKLGADHVISHREAFKPQLEAIGVAAVDYIYLCHETKPVWDQVCDIVAPQGAINTIVLLPGDGSTLDVWPLYFKAANFSTESMFARSMFKTADIEEQHKILTTVGQMVDAGQVKAVGNTHLGTINAANLAKGHGMLEDGHVVGKIVLEGW